MILDRQSVVQSGCTPQAGPSGQAQWTNTEMDMRTSLETASCRAAATSWPRKVWKTFRFVKTKFIWTYAPTMQPLLRNSAPSNDRRTSGARQNHRRWRWQLTRLPLEIESRRFFTPKKMSPWPMKRFGLYFKKHRIEWMTFSSNMLGVQTHSTQTMTHTKRCAEKFLAVRMPECYIC